MKKVYERKFGVIFENQNIDFYKFLESEFGIKNAKDKLVKDIHLIRFFSIASKKRFYVIECQHKVPEGVFDEKLRNFPHSRAILNYLLFAFIKDKKVKADLEYLHILGNAFLNNPKCEELFEYITKMESSYYFEEIPLKKLGIS